MFAKSSSTLRNFSRNNLIIIVVLQLSITKTCVILSGHEIPSIDDVEVMKARAMATDCLCLSVKPYDGKFVPCLAYGTQSPHSSD
jgi:hypothetical protein